MKEVITTMQQFARGCDALAQAFVNMQPLMIAVRQAAEEAYRITQEAYSEAGAPYGDTHEGMMRWLSECAEITRHEVKAEQIRQHHELLADLRKTLVAP